ncbi:hypothetical protein RSOLAG22IIIB_06080 [Rhizoctonia solani]|uniref:Mitochondrial carrier n=1 Tax=Rhizoctonia solani TaxID=456999 RepID=A0A0K6GBP2_9AGAM|nr:hypothetical protein RSOLAG22IIIB_06080 [Rhizoctonia solani]
MNILGAFVFLLFMLGPIALGLFILVPICGTIVRLRANYTPKGLQLYQVDDANTNESTHVAPETHIGPSISAIFNMTSRIYRLEGWSGFYKGFMPAYASTILFTLWAILSVPDHPEYMPRCSMHAPSTNILRGLLYGFGTLIISIPYEILFNRTVCTPHRLPCFKPMQALRIILTPYEIRKPWMLYLTPGLLATRMLIIVWVVAVARVVRAKLLPSLADGVSSLRDPENPDWTIKFLDPTQLGTLFLFCVCSTITLCPLEVIATRLSIQRNWSKTDTDHATGGVVEPTVEYIGQEEDVIALRSDEDPYTGLVDCVQRMVREEGVGSLFRAWWLTMIGVTLCAFS